MKKILSIQMKDLFLGFIHNVMTMGIRPRSKDTKSTNKVLGYFANLGEMLGFYTEYEWRRFDLLWFDSYEKREDGIPHLHIEHENSPDRLDDLIQKVKTSKAPFVIAIGYPSSKESHSKYVKRIERLHKKLAADKEVMFILRPKYDMNVIIAYRTRRSKLSVYKASKGSDNKFIANFSRR